MGPLLRYTGRTTATVWVETDAPARIAVECEDAAGAAETWSVFGRHCALVVVEGLAAGRSRAYRVLVDGRQVWPPRDSEFPPSVIRTLGDDSSAPQRITFGSCRWSRPPVPGESRERHLAPDALDTLALRLAHEPDAELPDALLLLGDQVYADEISHRMRNRLAERRDLSQPPGPQAADYEEYALLYQESWTDPQIRWLLSTVPTAMIFDDHEMIDDWNTSHSWRRDMAEQPWWAERITGAFASYWVYQHLGNLSPETLAEDRTFAAVQAAEAPEEATGILREFAVRADGDADQEDGARPRMRWSFRRDFGRTRLVMLDNRAGRVLTPTDRRMLSSEEFSWAVRQFEEGGYDHLLIGSSLPWLLPHAIHDLESWNEALCSGVWGPRAAEVGEKVRRAGDLEHWSAFRESFEEFSAELRRIAAEGTGSNGERPSTICVLSGDVHHAYVAEAHWPGVDTAQGAARVVQLTCSPLHNSVPPAIRAGFLFGWGRLATGIGRLLARHAGLPPRPLHWTKLGGPWFGNHLMTLTIHGRHAELALDRAESTSSDKNAEGSVGTGRARLRRIGRGRLR
ncbi:MAG TPA: alkaline phosphatase D family protein [Yinghuangia sp.]|nr:alkaline phosphatase D family protein [Yinghuangia sp.]